MKYDQEPSEQRLRPKKQDILKPKAVERITKMWGYKNPESLNTYKRGARKSIKELRKGNEGRSKETFSKASTWLGINSGDRRGTQRAYQRSLDRQHETTEERDLRHMTYPSHRVNVNTNSGRDGEEYMAQQGKLTPKKGFWQRLGSFFK